MTCIALTGAAGKLGRQLRPALAQLCTQLRLIDWSEITDPAGHERACQLDLSDKMALHKALSGCEAVVHFAGYPREAPWSTLLSANILGVTNLWECALEQGVKRIIYASSNHAVGFYPRSQLLDHRVPPLPDSRYGVTKVFMEGVASLYAIKHGLRGFGIRIGHCAPQPTDARMLSHWIHPEDLAQLVTVGLQADYEHEIVYGVSANTRSWWNNERAQAMGYTPRYSADAFIEQIENKRSGDPVAEHYQGGSFAGAEFSHVRPQLD